MSLKPRLPLWKDVCDRRISRRINQGRGTEDARDRSRAREGDVTVDSTDSNAAVNDSTSNLYP